MKNAIEEVEKYYDADPKREWNRLKSNPYEFLITTAWIDRYLQKNASILDIGGGPGRYSIHYALQGHPVTLLDLSSANVGLAKKKARQYKTKITAYQGDALDLSRFSDASFDDVFLMGPLYHLLEEKERLRALSEATRVLRKGGHLFASFIAMSGGMIYEMREDPMIIESPIDRIFYPLLIAEKSYSGQAFTQAYFATQREIASLFQQEKGLEQVAFFGQESITAPCCDRILSAPKKIRGRWLEVALSLSDKEDYLSFSEHWMGILRKK